MADERDVLHLELLLGRRVRDSNGCVAGRIEEFRAEVVNGEWVITEVHLGTAAGLERLRLAVARLPILSALPLGSRTVHCVRWDQISLEDPARPRTRIPREELRVSRPD